MSKKHVSDSIGELFDEIELLNKEKEDTYKLMIRELRKEIAQLKIEVERYKLCIQDASEEENESRTIT